MPEQHEFQTVLEKRCDRHKKLLCSLINFLFVIIYLGYEIK